MNARNKYFCAHGHFYQPPRENPWISALEPEESAHPYRDWNERIFQECYGPNSSCPVYDAEGRIAGMAENYRRMSFDFGPGLLGWLEGDHPAVYREILQADRESAKERGGHGNALAHPYYHAILPLQSLKDKRTLVGWGLADFQARFRRQAEGIWLPETAVDEETLEVLVAQGLRFTILSPAQAARVRSLGAGEEDWKRVNPETLAPTRPYRWLSREQPGRQMVLFFYHPVLSKSVESGEALAAEGLLCRKVLGRYLPDHSLQLVNIANDGEYYGHHRRAGNAALAQSLRLLEASGVTLANYAQFLDLLPPPQEVEIHPGTAWSCEHGLGRWKEDCGCRADPGREWNQKWRAPLRGALDWLGRELDGVYEGNAGAYFKDYRHALDAYAPPSVGEDGFIAREALVALSPEETVSARSLLEMQREKLAMFTSCGWFFDDISSLESALILAHAARAAEIASGFGAELEAGLKERLAHAPSNVASWRDGAGVYEKLVSPRRVSVSRAAAHFALLDLLGLGDSAPACGFKLKRRASARKAKTGPAGRDRAFCGVLYEIERLSTGERAQAWAAAHQQDRLDFTVRVSQKPQPEHFLSDLGRLFEEKDGEGFEGELASRLGAEHFALDALFPEDRLNVMRMLMPAPVRNQELRLLMERWAGAVAGLRRGENRGDEVLELLESCRERKLSPDQLPWISDVRAHLTKLLEAQTEKASPEALSRSARWIEAFERARLHVSVWEMQSLFWRWRAKILSEGAPAEERSAARALGEKLNFSDAALIGLTEAQTPHDHEKTPA